MEDADLQTSSRSAGSKATSDTTRMSPRSARKEGGLQRGLSKAKLEEPSTAQDDDDDQDIDVLGFDLDGEIPLSTYGINEKLPNGIMFAAISRMRRTTNGYCEGLSKPGWFADFRQPTMRALLRRLNSYGPKLEGTSEVELQIGYKQVVGRLAALINFWRSLTHWVSSQRWADLAKARKPLLTLMTFLDHMELTLAPDLRILRIAILFFGSLSDGRTLVDAIAGIDMEVLQKAREEFTDSCKGGGESVVKAEIATSGSPAGSRADDSGPTPKKKARTASRTELRVDFGAEPMHYVCTMLAEPLKTKLFNLVGDIVEKPTELHEFVRDLGDLHEALTKLLGSDAGKCEVVTIVKSLECIAACSLGEEGLRPPTEDVRQARRDIMSMSKQDTGSMTEVARAIHTFAGCKQLLARARDHAAGGLQDANADLLYTTAVAKFEGELGEAFEDLDRWLLAGNGGRAHDTDSFGGVLGAATEMAVDALHAVEQWSAVALQKRLQDVADFVDTSMELARLAIFVQASSLQGVLMDAAFRTSTAMSSRSSTNCLGSMMQSAAHVVEARDRRPSGDVAIVAAVEGQAATDGEFHEFNEIMNNCVLNVESAMTGVHVFHEKINSLMTSVTVCFDKVLPRAGDNFVETVSERTRPEIVKMDIAAAFEAFQNMGTYVIDACRLATFPPLLSETDFNQFDKDSIYYKALSTFCRLHRTHLQSPEPGLSCIQQQHDALVTLGQVATPMSTTFLNFFNNVGLAIYDSHTDSSLQCWVDHIVQKQVRANGVHPSVVSGGELSAILPRLVLVDFGDLLKDNFNDRPQDQTILEAFERFEHNRSFDLVEKFLTVTGIDALVVPHITKPGGIQQVPASIAMFGLSLTCMCRDIVVLVAALHQRLVLPAEGNTEHYDASRDQLFGDLTDSVAAMQTRLADLEDATKSATANDLEQAGYMMEPPIVVLRQWQACMAVFCGRRLQCLLTEFDSELQGVVAAARSALPAWEAVTDGNAWNMNLAKKLLCGRHGAIVKHHNMIHGCLVSMNLAGKALDVKPKLTDNDLTAGTVAIAQATMATLAKVSTIVMGADLLQKYSNHPQGPSMASAFISKYRIGDHGIPAAFWEQIECVAGHAAVAAAPSTGGAAPTTEIKVKPAAHSRRTMSKSSTQAQTSVKDELPPPPQDGGDDSLADADDGASSSKRGLKRLRRGAAASR